jgi:hypothetical protein
MCPSILLGPKHRTRFFLREGSTFLHDFKEPFTTVFIYLARNVRLGALEREDETTRVLFGAIVFNSKYQNVELKVENNSKGHLLNKNK